MNVILKKGDLVEQIIHIKYSKRISLIDAILEYCDESNLDFDDFSDVIKNDENFIEMIKKDAISENLLRKSDGWKRVKTLDDFF